MLQIKTFTFNPFSENTYIVYNGNQQCWIIDPGCYTDIEIQTLIAFIQNNQLKPQAIINTHAHIDHILGVEALTSKFNIPFYLHRAEEMIFSMAPQSAAMFGFKFRPITTLPEWYSDDETFSLGDDYVKVIHTPGHSPGSVSFYNEIGAWMVGGDVLFQGSIGRTDLPGGHHQTLIETIKTKIFTLPQNTIVYPGHGAATNVGYEQQNNPFF